MPDDFKPVTPGEEVNFSAQLQNAMISVASWYKTKRHDTQSGVSETFRNSGIIRVHNASGEDIVARGVLALEEPLFLPSDSEDAFLREVVFKGVVPMTAHRGRFCITLEPAKADRVVRAYVSGYCHAKIDVVHIGHAYADIKAGDVGVLQSCGSSCAKIIWLESLGFAPYDDNYYGGYTGDQWAIIRIGNEAGRGRACMLPTGGIGAANSDGTVPGKASCLMYDWKDSTETWVNSGVSEIVYNQGGEATGQGTIALVEYLQGKPFVMVERCP